MINIGGYEKNGFNASVGASRRERPGKPEKPEKKGEVKEKNFDRADFSSLIGGEQKTEAPVEEMKVEAASEKTAELSKTAQDYLEKLKKKYGNMDFIVADYKTDEEADKLLAKGKGEYNCLITPALLERMAADEDVAAEYEAKIDQGVESIEQVRTELGDDADMVDKYGVTFDSEGNMSIRAKLVEGLIGQDGSNTIKALTVEDMLAQLKEARDLQAEKLAKIREEKAKKDVEEETTADTGEVDKDINTLKNERKDVIAQLRAEQNDDKKAELEELLKQLDTEITEKDNDTYRKAHTHFSAEA
ncbi:MAG: hypothetical protein II820_01660 [Ruminiclostridium sp.]|nr:hypothetical protein [Ruminiclostridium sp.]